MVPLHSELRIHTPDSRLKSPHQDLIQNQKSIRSESESDPRFELWHDLVISFSEYVLWLANSEEMITKSFHQSAQLY